MFKYLLESVWKSNRSALQATPLAEFGKKGKKKRPVKAFSLTVLKTVTTGRRDREWDANYRVNKQETKHELWNQSVGKLKTFCLADEPQGKFGTYQKVCVTTRSVTHLFKLFGSVKATKEWKQTPYSHVLSLALVYRLGPPYLGAHLAPGPLCASGRAFLGGNICTARAHAQACAPRCDSIQTKGKGLLMTSS